MPRANSEDSVTVNDLVLKVETQKAFGVTVMSNGNITAAYEAEIDAWLAKSQVREHTFEGVMSAGSVVIPRWLADKNSLVYID